MTDNGTATVAAAEAAPNPDLIEIRCQGLYRRRGSQDPETCGALLATVDKLPACELVVSHKCKRCNKVTRWGVSVLATAQQA